jgi:hypothetical protein
VRLLGFVTAGSGRAVSGTCEGADEYGDLMGQQLIRQEARPASTGFAVAAAPQARPARGDRMSGLTQAVAGTPWGFETVPAPPSDTTGSYPQSRAEAGTKTG